MNMSIRACLLCEWAEILCVCGRTRAWGGGGGGFVHQRAVDVVCLVHNPFLIFTHNLLFPMTHELGLMATLLVLDLCLGLLRSQLGGGRCSRRGGCAAQWAAVVRERWWCCWRAKMKATVIGTSILWLICGANLFGWAKKWKDFFFTITPRCFDLYWINVG